jgi:hypothetical protein
VNRLVAIQAAAVKFFAASEERESLCGRALLQQASLLCERAVVAEPGEQRLSLLAAILTLLLAAADDLGLSLSLLRSRKLLAAPSCSAALSALGWKCKRSADATDLNDCFAAFFAAQELSGFWLAQVQTIAARRLAATELN